MPIYEFRCNACHRKTSIFQRSISSPIAVKCPFCGSEELVRSISSFAFHKSSKTIYEEAGEPEMFPKNPDYYKDPRNIGRWTEKRAEELGLELPSQIQEEIAAAREGELPESLKEQL
jgi:putative FmdB family regulatory protein